MSLDTSAVLAQIDEVLARAGASKDNPQPRMATTEGAFGVWVDGNGTAMSSAMLALIRRTADAIAASDDLESYETVNGLVGVVVSLRADIEADYLQTIAQLIHADVFADFLEMADELQSKGFKDPAAVLTGSVLEEHLRNSLRQLTFPRPSQEADQRKQTR